MFHGSVTVLLEKEPTGGLTRSHLYPFIMDYLNVSCRNARIMCWNYDMPLCGLIPRPTGLHNSLSCMSFLVIPVVPNDFPPDDTANLFTFSVMRLTVRVLSSGLSSWSCLGKGPGSSQSCSTGTMSSGNGDSMHASCY